MTKSETLPTLLACFILHGCIPMGDAATRIEGRLIDQKSVLYDRCNSEIFALKGGAPFNYRQISGEFDESFVIFAGQKHYKQRLSCDDAENDHAILLKTSWTTDVTSPRSSEEMDRPSDEQILARWWSYFDRQPVFKKNVEDGYQYLITPEKCWWEKDMLLCSSNLQIIWPDGTSAADSIVDIWRKSGNEWEPW